MTSLILGDTWRGQVSPLSPPSNSLSPCLRQKNGCNTGTLAHHPRVVGQRYWVKCEGFQCMATAGYDGKWIIFPSGEELTSAVLSFWQ